MRHQITKRLARVAALAGLFSLVLTAAGQLFGLLWWPLELASHFVPYYAAALAPACVVLLRRSQQRRPRLGWLCVAALGWNLLLLWPAFAPSSSVRENAAAVRVLALNVHTANDRFSDVLKLVAQHDPDVVILQEVDPRWVDAMQSLEQGYPNTAIRARSDNFGIAVYTRLPTESIEVVDVGSGEVPSIEMHAKLGERPFSLLATHPLPPIGRDYAAARNNQMAAMADWARNQESPAIVAGDMNITPWSPYFRKLLRDGQLRDSSRGHGLTATWRAVDWLPGIPIDHVLVSQEWSVQRYEVGLDVGSDHLPVIVDLELR